MPEQQKVLVIDDEEINTLQLEHILQNVCSVSTCNDSCSASKLISDIVPDILLLDLEMPKVSGFDILQEVKDNPSLSDLRVIVITSHNDPNIEAKALTLGAIDFITKPLNLALCRMRVENHLRIKAQAKEILKTKNLLASEKEQLRITLDSIADGVISTDENGRITYMNPVAQRLTGWQQVAAKGRLIEDVMDLRDASTKTPSLNPLMVALKENRSVAMAINTQLTSQQGIIHRVEDSAAPILDAEQNQRGAVMVFQDVSETLAMTTQMTYLANHDQLTALPNRVLLHDRMAQGIARADANDTCLSLLLLDLDNFKYINDSLGHHIGDEIIAHVGHSLDQFANGDITVARVGGDEFALVVPQKNNRFALEALITQVLNAISKPFRLDSEQYVLSASVGISVYPKDASTVEEMMRHADTAMYKAKQTPTSSYYFFSDDLQCEIDQRLEVGSVLKDSLENKLLEVHYQPKYSFTTGKIVGVEGLVRLRNESGEFISPIHFIQYAEESGLIFQLGDQVLEKCCADAKKWLGLGFPTKVAVNISAKQFLGRVDLS
ncbi:GGDEF/EAL domain-containing response regulator [Pseudoalteromonas 'SMAR']|uniref:GGDEF/EAL domain-containing response regulator n=1 Tax=Pseudoalteromonas 'SMAR' TaxID=3416908 RepID=UPI003AF266E2